MKFKSTKHGHTVEVNDEHPMLSLFTDSPAWEKISAPKKRAPKKTEPADDAELDEAEMTEG